MLALILAAMLSSESFAVPSCPESYAQLSKQEDSTPSRLLFRERAALVSRFLAELVSSDIPRVPMRAPRGFLRKSAAQINASGRDLARLLLPIPLPRRDLNEIETIFLFQWGNPARELMPREKELLTRAGALPQYLAREKIMRTAPWVNTVKSSARVSAQGLLLVEASLAVNQAREMAGNTSTIRDFRGEPSETAEGKPKVQLLVEAPVPHTALRIGNRVYSYGVDRLNVTDVHEYLATPEMEDTAPGPSASVAKRSANRMLARNVRVTDLQFSDEEIRNLRRELEANAGKVYVNRTFINDCASMIARALRKHTTLDIPLPIDPLPTVSSTYLSARRLLGDPRVGPTRLVVFSPDEKPAFSIGRNAVVALYEAKIALSAAPFNLTARAYTDLSSGEEGLQFHTPEQKRTIETWRSEARQGVKRELEEILGEGNYTDPSKRALARATLSRKLAEKKEELSAALDAPLAEFKDLVEASAKLDSLADVEADWAKKLKD
jgi:hypothetical protein